MLIPLPAPSALKSEKLISMKTVPLLAIIVKLLQDQITLVSVVMELHVDKEVKLTLMLQISLLQPHLLTKS